jgi:hypothetical protein
MKSQEKKMNPQEETVLQQVLEQILVDVKEVFGDHGLEAYEIVSIEFRDQMRGVVCRLVVEDGVPKLICS